MGTFGGTWKRGEKQPVPEGIFYVQRIVWNEEKIYLDDQKYRYSFFEVLNWYYCTTNCSVWIYRHDWCSK